MTHQENYTFVSNITEDLLSQGLDGIPEMIRICIKDARFKFGILLPIY